MSVSIVFVDGRIAATENLLANFAPGLEVVLLDNNQDGLTQIQQALAGRTGLDAIHVVSHGAQGTMYLGSSILTGDNLSAFQAQWAQIGASLSDQGDMLLYGCDIAQGDSGQAFIEQLARYTGADVAASTDLTGLHGNWTLESATGSIAAQALAPIGLAIDLGIIKGTEGNDTLVGDGLDNTIYGYGGNDTIDGQAAADWIDGGAGDDTIDGNFGNDTVYGGSGNDSLIDSQGSNLMYGQEGDDSLVAKALTGNHTLAGGLGNDYIDGVGQTLLLQGGDGADFCFAHGDLSCWIPCDHLPRRSWPLFRAGDVMAGVLASMKAEHRV